MVLHHIAHDTVLVEIAATAFNADRFSPGNLDALDVFTAPQGFKDAVGETQNHQVLDHFLPQIVVDSEDLVLGEDQPELTYELVRRGAVMPERLFDYDA